MSIFRKSPFSSIHFAELHWQMQDPFTYSSNHQDDYPHGNAQLAPPREEIGGRSLGRDYQKILGFRMYHGRVVPGFPMHAHWGYETITIAEKGFIDHFDEEGNNGRFGEGDIQWVLASGRYSHCEMYPLLNQTDRNPMDVTQIHLNIPVDSKNGPNEVNNTWAEDVPVIEGDGWMVKIVCGSFMGRELYSPNKRSYAKPENAVRIMKISMEPGASVTIDATVKEANRNLYFTEGKDATVLDTRITFKTGVTFDADKEFTILNGEAPSTFWLLEGVPIGQRMTSFGPVILGDLDSVRSAMDEIRLNEYVKWPYEFVDMTQPIDAGRFLQRNDGTVERPPSA